MRLNSIVLEHLQYLEASQFITRLFSDMSYLTLELKKDKEMDEHFQLLNTQAEEFYNSLVQIKAMTESKKLEELDLMRDQKISTIRLHIEAFRYREEKEIKNAYAAAQLILHKFEEIESLNYEAESKAVQKFLDGWNKPEHADLVKFLQLQVNLDHLKVAAYAFDDLFNNRSALILRKETYDAKVLYKSMLATYTNLAKYILAMAIFKKDENLYPALLDVFNNGRKYFADVIARRKGSGKGGDAPDASQEIK